MLDRRWFHGKRCLDIGCNEGVITLAAVQRFAPLSMLGVDIDEGLIKTACRCVQLLEMYMNALGTDMLCQQRAKQCVQICAAAWGEDFCVRKLPVDVLLQMTTVQLVQLHSMLYEPILLYPNKVFSDSDSFKAGHPLMLSQSSKLTSFAQMQ